MKKKDREQYKKDRIRSKYVAPLNEHGQPLNRNFNAKRLTHRAVDELIGICKGIEADGIVNKDEAAYLVLWLESSKEVIDVWPANILNARIEKMLVDGAIDENERKELSELLKEIIGSKDSNKGRVDLNTGELIENLTRMSFLLPLDKPSPAISFKNKLFCLTGKFFYGPRKTCEIEIEAKGGHVQEDVTQNTNYLVIGLLGSTDWLHSTHGTKIQYAVALRDKGYPISIISEEHWTNYL